MSIMCFHKIYALHLDGDKVYDGAGTVHDFALLPVLCCCRVTCLVE
jgi:hypothetical protein